MHTSAAHVQQNIHLLNAHLYAQARDPCQDPSGTQAVLQNIPFGAQEATALPVHVPISILVGAPFLNQDTVSPVNADALADMLIGYSCEKASFLINGFRHGFQIHFSGTSFTSERSCNNLKSAIEMPNVVSTKLQKELAANRVAGPFKNPPLVNFHISPLGVVPKKTLGSFRLIHHLSYPEGQSVNDGISDEYCTVQYSTIQDAIAFIKINKQSFMAKTDIESAFRIIPIHPSNHHLLGFKWNKQYYYDKCLPMGLSESCRIFEEFSTALEWVAYHKLGATSVVRVLDDFLFIENSEEKTKSILMRFQDMCSKIGIPLAGDKTFGPKQVMIFLGITLDATKFEARLPLDKLAKCRELCKNFKIRKKATLKELHGGPTSD